MLKPCFSRSASGIQAVIISVDLLEFLGKPSPMVMLRLFPPGLSCARSPWPLWKATTLEPPPPQPSFFTLNSSLEGKQVSAQPPLKKPLHWCECVGFYPACHWRRLPAFSSTPPHSVSRAGWGTLSWKWTPAGCRTETHGGQKSHPVSYCAQQIQEAVRERLPSPLLKLIVRWCQCESLQYIMHIFSLL